MNMEQTVDLSKMPYYTTRDDQNKTFSVIFLDEKYVDELAYKVLSNVVGTNLLCGIKSVFNGKTTLTYNISDYVPLISKYDSLTKAQVFDVIGGLLDALEQIYDIGFLLYDKDTISFQPDEIFLKAGSCQVYLLYKPSCKEQPIGWPSFERTFCVSLQSILNKIPAAKSMTRFTEALSSPQTLAQLRELLHQEISNPLPEPPPEPAADSLKPEPPPKPKPKWIWPWKKPKPEVWRLVGINTPIPVRLTLTGESFIVGRSDQKAQGLVTFSPNIGREHCRFLLQRGTWYLEDLNSRNGTYLNGQKLEPNQKYKVKAGDLIKLSTRNEFRLQKG